MRAVSAILRTKALLLALFLCWAQAAFAEVAVPPLVGRVVDTTNTLNSSYIETLNQRIRSFEQRKGSQIAVLIVPTTQPETIEQYSIRAAEAWKIGRKKIDDGALLVIAKNDHKLRIEVGYGLEGALTDVTARRIIDEVIAPHFKTGDFAGGISEGLTRMIGVIDGERLPSPAPEASHGPDARLECAVFNRAFFHLRRPVRRRLPAHIAGQPARIGRSRRRGRGDRLARVGIAACGDRGGRTGVPGRADCGFLSGGSTVGPPPL